ncbi:MULTISPECIES: hypothetical protein [Massilia]|jgi:ABC-2 type transport system permease protein|nr:MULTISPECIES: hypothetical protein [Massilia]
MTQADLARLPRYEHVAAPGRLPTGQLLALGVVALALLAIGLRKLRT